MIPTTVETIRATIDVTKLRAVVAAEVSGRNTARNDDSTRFLIPTTVETIRATIDVTKLRAADQPALSPVMIARATAAIAFHRVLK